MFLPKFTLGLAKCASGRVAFRIEPRRQVLIPLIWVRELTVRGGYVHNTGYGGLGEEEFFNLGSPVIVSERRVIDDYLKGYSKFPCRRMLLPQLGTHAVRCQTVS
jgi:hypothetical protein